jgi:hypothetical protein
MKLTVRRRIGKVVIAVAAVVFITVAVLAIIPGRHPAVLEDWALICGSISMASMSGFLFSTRGRRP